MTCKTAEEKKRFWESHDTLEGKVSEQKENRCQLKGNQVKTLDEWLK